MSFALLFYLNQAAFEVIASEPELMARLQRNRERYVTGLRRHGFDLLETETAIAPILCRTEEQAYEMTRGCQASG